MPVYLDVESRFSQQAAAAAAREAVRFWNQAGKDISKGLSGALSRGFATAFDASGSRAQLLKLQNEFRLTADAEAEMARRMVRSAGEVEVAQRRAAEAQARYSATSSQVAKANIAVADSQARAARDQRDYADAMVANEAAHRKLATSTAKTAAATTTAARVFNGVGAASAVAFGAAIVDTTKKAGDFQQAMIKLHAAADVNAADMKTVSDGLLQMAGKVGYTANQLADGFYTVAKAGYKGTDALQVLKSSAQLASIEQTDLTETTIAVTTSLNDFGMSASQAANVASMMKVAVGDAKTSLSDFAGALHSIEPIAKVAHLSLAEVYADTARITQSGTSPDQATQNIAQTVRSLMAPTEPMRSALGKIGLSTSLLQTQLGDPKIGLVGVLKEISDAIESKVGPSGKVAIDTFYQNADATAALKTAYDALSPSAKAMADQLNAGTVSLKQIRQAAMIDPQLKQWMTMRQTVDGFSQNLKRLQPALEPVEQLWKEVTGGVETFNVAAQLVGTPEALQKTSDEIAKVSAASADAQGNVAGFKDTQDGLNQKMRDAKAAFNAAEIEIGNLFVPVMTDAANVALAVGNAMAKHPAILKDATIAVGALGTAWAGIKIANIVGTVLRPIIQGVEVLAGTEDAAAISAGRLKGALAGVALAAGAQMGGQYLQDHTSGFWHSASVVGTDAATGAALGAGVASIIPGVGTAVGAAVGGVLGAGIGVGNQLAGHAHGGPVHGHGPKGIDSVLTWLAPGEHVLTHHDVAAMGGHHAVHAFRNALHRQDGGPIGDDGGPLSRLYQEADALNGGPYVWGSTDCSGAVSMLVDAALGTSGRMSTATAASWLAAKGFQPGYQPGALNIGWYNGGPGGGHMAATLPDGTHFESGGQHGGIMLGGGAAGAESSEFTNHMYLPVQGLYPDGPGGGMGGMGSPGAFGFGAGGGIPAGSVAGTGPGGQQGYYTPNPQRVAAASEQLRHINAEIADAEKKRDELQANAKQSERDALNEQIKHLEAERAQAQEKLAEAQRGTFHAMRGGGGGSPFLPVALADHFGLGKGLPGLAEWVVGFLEDLVLGPMETAAMAAVGGGSSTMMPGALGAPGAGMPGSFIPTLPPSLAAHAGPSGGGGPSGASGGGAASSGSPDAATDWPHDGWASEYATATTPPDPATTPAGPPGFQANGLIPSTKGIGPERKVSSQEQIEDMLNGFGPATPDMALPDHPAPKPPSGPTAFGVAVRGIDKWLHGSPLGMAPIGAPSPGLHRMHVTPRPKPPPPPPPPKPKPPFDLSQAAGGNAPTLLPYGPVEHHAKGGPIGTDTIPAWLSPGEFVVNAKATSQWLPYLQFMNAGHYHTGGPTSPPAPPAPAPPATAQPGTQGAIQPPPGQQPKPPNAKPGTPSRKQLPPNQLGQALDAAQKGTKPGADIHNLPGLATPGAGSEQPGTGLPASKGIGFSGGVISAAEGAATSAASAAASMGSFGGGGAAASAAMSIGFQELNRAAAYGAQVAGIGVEGLMEALKVSGSSTGGDWSKTIPGRLLMGVTGVRPSKNLAGTTMQPDAQSQGPDTAGDQIGNQFFGPVHVHGVQSPEQFNKWSNEQSQFANHTYAFSGGR